MMEILIPILAVTVIGLICAVGLAVASSVMAVKEDTRFTEIRACLPGANCGACGYTGCDGYAKALLEPGTKTNLCVPGADAVAAQIAALLGVDAAKIFKTLVTRGASKGIYVFVIPVGAELDLKKAAKAVGEKSIEMVHVSEINALTGYIRGGCSPVGMRKHYTTTYDASALAQDTMIVSAGKIGFQVELEPQALIRITQGKTADVTVG